MAKPLGRPLPSVADLAKARGTHPMTEYREIQRGHTRCIRVGRTIRIPWSEFYRLVGEEPHRPGEAQ
jgi:hypothetical protein